MSYNYNNICIRPARGFLSSSIYSVYTAKKPGKCISPYVFKYFKNQTSALINILK